MISTITNPSICVRILQIPRFAGSGSVSAKRPKSKNKVPGFLYVRQFEIDFLSTVSERIFSRPNQKFANTGCNGANRIQGTRRIQAARRRQQNLNVISHFQTCDDPRRGMKIFEREFPYEKISIK